MNPVIEFSNLFFDQRIIFILRVLRKQMDLYETFTAQQKAAVLDKLVYNSELFEEENFKILEQAIAAIGGVKKQSTKKEVEKVEQVADIFDFEKYQEEYKVFSLFYGGLELYLRCAIFLDYKYNHLQEKDRKIVEFCISKKTGNILQVVKNGNKKVGRPLKKGYLDEFTNVFETIHLFEAWYLHFDSNRVEKIENTLDRYEQHTDVLWNRMYRKYVDEDWVYKPLWFTEKSRITSQGKRQTMVQYYKTHQ